MAVETHKTTNSGEADALTEEDCQALAVEAAEKKKAHCLRKALGKSQAEFDHALVVFEYASRPDRLGPIAGWPEGLWRALYHMFGSWTACAVQWGPDFALLYNTGYACLAGHRHPRCLGLPMSHADSWGEVWNALRPQFERAWNGSTVYTGPGQFNLWDADEGRTLERHFDYSLSSIDDDDGSPLGILNSVIECTEQVFSDRCYGVAMPAISRASAYQPLAGDFFTTLLEGLQSNPLDLPAVLVYEVDDSFARLVAKIGSASEDAPQLPQQHTIGSASNLALCKLLNQLDVRQPVAVDTCDEQLLGAFELPQSRPLRGRLYPITSKSSNNLIAAVFVGLNPDRRFEGSYNTFLELVVSHIGSSLRDIRHLKAQLRHHEDIASLNAAKSVELETALEKRSRELLHAELRYTKMTENSPAGIFVIHPNGSVIYANKAAWTLAGSPTPDFQRIDALLQEVGRWVHPSCIEAYTAKIGDMLATTEPMEQTYRAANDLPDGSARWLKITTVVEKDDNGTALLYHGFCVDVSHIKQLEDLTNKRIGDALESRRQQEAFIDMTSHEMRNPLSAIAQTAELVTAGLKEANILPDVPRMQQVIAEALDLVSNIHFLSRHMHCIADDMIAISKIDSNLLSVRPRTMVVTEFMRQVSGMFAAETKAQRIEMRLRFDPTSILIDETCCQFDPARVSQILINLINNAIKHVSRQSGPIRSKSIDISVELTAQPPFALNLHGALTIPKEAFGVFTPPESPDGIEIPAVQYLVFSVQDNGDGLSQKEADKILKGFTKQGPKTHSTYGGSGLSLFICRRLAELHGGQICSQPVPAGSSGTRFVFFIRAPPQHTIEDLTLSPMDVLGDHYFSRHGKPEPLRHSKDESRNSPAVFQANQPLRGTSTSSMTSSPAVPHAAIALHSPIRALVVEDNILNQRLLQKQLEKAGYSVDVANNGLECLEKIKSETAFDIVLLDREMPICDGLTCLMHIRESEKQHGALGKQRPRLLEQTEASRPAKLAVITISANARKEQINEMMNAGSDDYVTKPFRFPDLDARIKMLLK